MYELTLREGQQIKLSDVARPEAPLRSTLAEIGRTNGKLRAALKLRQGPISLQLDGASSLCVAGVAGSLRLLGRRIEILPKFSGEASWHDNIMVLLARAYGARFDLQEMRSALHKPRSFVDHVGQAYVRALEAGLIDGPIETYHDVEHAARVARGRIDLRRSVTAALCTPGIVHSLASELHADNPYNRLLHAAADILLRLISDPDVRADLSRVRDALPVPAHGADPPSRLPDRPPLQFSSYSEALEIASAVVQGRDWGVGAASSTAFGYVVGMERLFEKFVENTLRSAVALLPAQLEARAERQVSTQFAAPLVPGRRPYFTRPDNVIYLNGAAGIIVDAKYKRFTDAETGNSQRPSNSDVYQMFASMAAQRCRIALLLYPTTEDLMGPLPVWEMVIGEEKAFVAAAGLAIADLRSSADLTRMDHSLAEICMEILANTHGDRANDSPTS